MMYEPHILKKKIPFIERDEYGRISSSKEHWVRVGRCRCDDNNFKYFTTESGKVYRPQYHIIAHRDIVVSPGDEIEVYNGKYLRAKGRVYNVTKLNYLDYSEIWV